MKKIILLLLGCACILSVDAKKPKVEDETMRYEIESAGVGAQGTYLLQVGSYAKNAKKVTADLIKRNAVHGVVFRGVTGRDGQATQRPLAVGAAGQGQNDEFFTRFFGPEAGYLKYADILEGTTKTTRVGKEYRVTTIVSVAKDNLRRDLEAAGVVRGLSTGF